MPGADGKVERHQASRAIYCCLQRLQWPGVRTLVRGLARAGSGGAAAPSRRYSHKVSGTNLLAGTQPASGARPK